MTGPEPFRPKSKYLLKNDNSSPSALLDNHFGPKLSTMYILGPQDEGLCRSFRVISLRFGGVVSLKVQTSGSRGYKDLGLRV